MPKSEEEIARDEKRERREKRRKEKEERRKEREERRKEKEKELGNIVKSFIPQFCSGHFHLYFLHRPIIKFGDVRQNNTA